LGAEGIIFISAEDSPNGEAIVILANEVSSTLSIFAVNTCASLSAVVSIPTNTSACAGESIELSAAVNANVSSQWFKDGQAFGMMNAGSISATESGVYHLEVSNALLQCNHSYSDIVVTIHALPVLTVPADAAICVGDEIQLSAQGAESIVWNGTLANGSSVTPAVSEVYTAVGTNEFGCESTQQWDVQVNELPVVNAGEDVTVCEGTYVEFNATGASDYVWSNGVSNTYGLIVYVTEEISVIGTNAFGCQDADTLMVTTLMNENFYFDADGDGFGDLNTLSIACVQPAGYVTNATDCNDTNFSINTEAAEVCNDIDDDCNGEVDNGLTYSTYYADSDGDTYGDINNSESFCTDPGSLFVTNDTDCDDTNELVNPAATEVWENGIDDDCNPNTSDVSVGELSAFAFNLFPNPTAERITISRSSSETSSVEIYNSLGALVHTSTVFGSQTIIDVSVFPAGYYVVRVNGMSKTFVKL
jgi:hypothetical protein